VRLEMKIKNLSIILLALFIFSALVWAGDDHAARLHLPRSKVIGKKLVKLGDIGIMNGEKELVNRLGMIELGQFSVNGQKIVIDRRTIESRVVSSDIDIDKLHITGAERVVVKRNEETIDSDSLVEKAGELIEEAYKDDKEAEISLVREPKDFVVAKEEGDVKLVPKMRKYQSGNKTKIRVEVIQDGVKKGERDVLFSRMYNVKRAVASIDIERGQMLTADNVSIEIVKSPVPQDKEFVPPFGLIATKAISRGRIITDMVAGVPQSPIIIKRRENVIMRIDTKGLLVTAQGVAMQDGRAGEVIRVKNINGRGRVVVCRVNADGSVEPVF
jgi:flagella basal body P-ring formation protein FlgA